MQAVVSFGERRWGILTSRYKLHFVKTYAISYVFIQEEFTMTILNATEARTKLDSLIVEATDTHQPIIITGQRGNAVLVSEEYWNAIAETLHLLSVPGMRESIKEGMDEPVTECSKEPAW